MIRKSSERMIDTKQAPFGGPGEVIVRNILNSPEEFYGKGRTFCHSTLPSGSGLGYHQHTGETEIYYILSGSGKYNDNGAMVPVAAGDITLTRDGEGHGLTNTGEEPLDLIALILYK